MSWAPISSSMPPTLRLGTIGQEFLSFRVRIRWFLVRPEGLEPPTLGLEDGSALSILFCPVLPGAVLSCSGASALRKYVLVVYSSLPNALLVFTAWDSLRRPEEPRGLS